jgi:Fe-S cluster biogenesis protein NfuA
MSAIGNGEFQSYTARIAGLVERASALADAEAQATSLELLQSLMDLHGAVVSRIVEVLGASEAGRASLVRLGADPLVCGLFVLYGVHPVALEERVSRALAEAAPRLRKRGGSAELLSISESAVRVRIQSSGHGCGSSLEALKDAVSQAILEAAPEIAEVAFEGEPASASGFVPLNLLQSAPQEEKKREEDRYEKSAA